MTEQVADTSLSLAKQGATTSSIMVDDAMQYRNQEFVAAGDCTEEAMQSENTAEATASLSMPEQDATCKSHRDGLDVCILHGGGHPDGEPGSSIVPFVKSEASIKYQGHSGFIVMGDAGNAMGSTGIYNLDAQEEPEGDTEKDEDSDFEAEREALWQEVSKDVVAVSPSPEDNEKEISRFRKFYDRKGKKQVNTSAAECNKQLSIVHTKGVQPTLHDGHSRFREIGNIGNGTDNTGDGEVVVSKYQGCSTPSQRNTMYWVHNGGSVGCVIEGCTEGAHGGTPLCICHGSRLHKKCCAVTGCTNVACTSSQGRTDRCVKHGGGKRCKYDGCGKGARGRGNTDFCIRHGGGKRCKFEGCGKSAQGRSNYCVKHGGDRYHKMCKHDGCGKVAQGRTDFCVAHGGGRRCKFEGCGKSAPGRGDYCVKHGGDRRYKMCKHDGCGKIAQGRTDFCVAHGGGRRCMFEGCGKSAPWRSDYCIKHGGGRRCEFQGCSVPASCGTDFCSVHRKSVLSSGNSAHEMLLAPPPKRLPKKAEPCKRRNSCSLIGGMARKRQNHGDYVNDTGSITVVEMGEERGGVLICQNNMPKAQQTACETNSESWPRRDMISVATAPTSPTVSRF